MYILSLYPRLQLIFIDHFKVIGACEDQITILSVVRRGTRVGGGIRDGRFSGIARSGRGGTKSTSTILSFVVIQYQRQMPSRYKTEERKTFRRWHYKPDATNKTTLAIFERLLLWSEVNGRGTDEGEKIWQHIFIIWPPHIISAKPFAAWSHGQNNFPVYSMCVTNGVILIKP